MTKHLLLPCLGSASILTWCVENKENSEPREQYWRSPPCPQMGNLHWGQIDLSAWPALNSPLALFAGFCFHLLVDLPCVGIAMCHVVDANTCLRSRELNTDIFRQTSPSVFRLSLHCIHHRRSVANTVAGCVFSKTQNRWTAGHSERELLDLSWSLADRKLWEL